MKSKAPKEAFEDAAPSARTLLDRAMATIGRELEKIESVSKKDGTYPMAPEHMHSLKEYTKALVSVDKNERDNPDEDDGLPQSDEDLLIEAKKAIKEAEKEKATK